MRSPFQLSFETTKHLGPSEQEITRKLANVSMRRHLRYIADAQISPQLLETEQLTSPAEEILRQDQLPEA